jgi:ankyrin repeat protein
MGNKASSTRKPSNAGKATNSEANPPQPIPEMKLPDVHTVDDRGRTALHTAILIKQSCSEQEMEQSEKYIRALISNGADVEARDNDDLNPLLLAVQTSDHLSPVQILLSADADPMTTDKNGQTILHLAVIHGRTKILDFILERHKKLIQASENSGGCFPIHLAVRSANVKFVEKLLDAGADIEARARGGLTPLLMIGNYSRFLKTEQRHALINLLVDRGADLNAVNDTGRNILMQVISEGNCNETIEFLLKYKRIALDIVSGSWEKKTVLMYAAEKGVPERYVKMLLEEGAFPNIVSSNDKLTAAEIARKQGYIRIADLIESYMTTDGATTGKSLPLPPKYTSTNDETERKFEVQGPPSLTALIEQVKLLTKELENSKKDIIKLQQEVELLKKSRKVED